MTSDFNPEAQSYQPDLFFPQIESQKEMDDIMVEIWTDSDQIK